MDIMSLISNLAFPAFCCVAMGYYVKYQSDRHREDINNLLSMHRTEENAMTLAINNNTIALTKLCERIPEAGRVEENGSDD